MGLWIKVKVYSHVAETMSVSSAQENCSANLISVCNETRNRCQPRADPGFLVGVGGQPWENPSKIKEHSV